MNERKRRTLLDILAVSERLIEKCDKAGLTEEVKKYQRIKDQVEEWLDEDSRSRKS